MNAWCRHATLALLGLVAACSSSESTASGPATDAAAPATGAVSPATEPKGEKVVSLDSFRKK